MSQISQDKISLDPQYLNYLSWLEDRGLPPLPAVRHAQKPVEAVTQATSAPLTVPSLFRVMIVVDRLEQADEHEMVIRIAGALGLDPKSYRIALGEQPSLEASSHILALGPGGATMLAQAGLEDIALNELRPHLSHGCVLLIPHPRAMLAQPQLKVNAWHALLKFKETFG